MLTLLLLVNAQIQFNSHPDAFIFILVSHFSKIYLFKHVNQYSALIDFSFILIQFYIYA